jgi:hypothetical protein
MRKVVLGALLVVLAFVLYRAWTSLGAQETLESTSGAPPSAGARAAASRSARSSPPAVTAPDVHLRALDDERPKPGPANRNLFRFKPKAPPPAPPSTTPPVGVGPSLPAGPPPPPPIPLRFAGVVEAGQPPRKIASLIDTTGHSFKGSEGEVVAGQYRILKIGAESIEMSYLDGRGRQTIRMSGS